MCSTSTALTKPRHAEGMSDEVLRTSSQTLDSLVKTCSIGWIISWKRRGSIFSMHAITSAKFASAPISWMVTTPTRGLCMNSTGVIFTNALIARKIKRSWVKSVKCTPLPPQQGLQLEDHLGTLIRFHAEIRPQTERVHSTTSTPFFHKQCGSPKNPPSSTLCWTIIFRIFGGRYPHSTASTRLFPGNATLFCNNEVKFKDIGAFMQQYVWEHHMSDKPRRLLLSGMKAKKIHAFFPLPEMASTDRSQHHQIAPSHRTHTPTLI